MDLENKKQQNKRVDKTVKHKRRFERENHMGEEREDGYCAPSDSKQV